MDFFIQIIWIYKSRFISSSYIVKYWIAENATQIIIDPARLRSDYYSKGLEDHFLGRFSVAFQREKHKQQPFIGFVYLN